MRRRSAAPTQQARKHQRHIGAAPTHHKRVIARSRLPLDRVHLRETRRVRRARHHQASPRPPGNPADSYLIAPSQVSPVQQLRPCRVEFHHEPLHASATRPHRIRRYRKVRRAGQPRNIRVSTRIHRDPRRRIVRVPAQIGRPHQPSACADLRRKRMRRAPTRRARIRFRMVGPGRYGQIRRKGDPGQKHVALTITRHRIHYRPAPAKVRHVGCLPNRICRKGHSVVE